HEPDPHRGTRRRERLRLPGADPASPGRGPEESRSVVALELQGNAPSPRLIDPAGSRRQPADRTCPPPDVRSTEAPRRSGSASGAGTAARPRTHPCRKDTVDRRKAFRLAGAMSLGEAGPKRVLPERLELILAQEGA